MYIYFFTLTRIILHCNIRVMLGKVFSCAVVGLEGYIVEVEVDISSGLPKFFVVGLPDEAIQESRERVRGAIRNSGFKFPMTRITANLAPADLKEGGTGLRFTYRGCDSPGY